MPDNLKLIRNEVGKGPVNAGLTRAATLVVITTGSRDPLNLSAGKTLTEENVGCRGLVIRWNKKRLNATDVVAGDRVVMLIGKSLRAVVPKIGDKITIESVTSRIIDIERDAASATYSCLTRS